MNKDHKEDSNRREDHGSKQRNSLNLML